MKLPHFIMVGGGRCGSTFFYQLLRQHPDIYLPEPRIWDLEAKDWRWATKDLHFFDQIPASEKNLDMVKYSKNFQGAKERFVIGEVATSYIYFEWVPSLISELLGDIKLIFLLRNPIDRAYSHYWTELVSGKEVLSFKKGIQAEPSRLKSGYISRYHCSYIDRGYYWRQVSRFIPLFSQENLMFILSEDLYKDPKHQMQRVCDFINVDTSFDFQVNNVYRNKINYPIYPSLYRLLNKLFLIFQGKKGLWRLSKTAKKMKGFFPTSGNSYPLMKKKTRERLRRLFEKDIIELANYLGMDLSHWQ